MPSIFSGFAKSFIQSLTGKAYDYVLMLLFTYLYCWLVASFRNRYCEVHEGLKCHRLFPARHASNNAAKLSLQNKNTTINYTKQYKGDNVNLEEIDNDGVISFLVKVPGSLSSHVVGNSITVCILNVMMNLHLK